MLFWLKKWDDVSQIFEYSESVLFSGKRRETYVFDSWCFWERNEKNVWYMRLAILAKTDLEIFSAFSENMKFWVEYEWRGMNRPDNVRVTSTLMPPMAFMLVVPLLGWRQMGWNWSLSMWAVPTNVHKVYICRIGMLKLMGVVEKVFILIKLKEMVHYLRSTIQRKA